MIHLERIFYGFLVVLLFIAIVATPVIAAKATTNMLFYIFLTIYGAGMMLTVKERETMKISQEFEELKKTKFQNF